MSHPLPTRRAAPSWPSLVSLVAALLLASVVAPPVSAKMFGQARLDAQVSLQSPPGEKLLVGAVVEVLGDDGELQAGAGVPVILELVGRYGDRTSAEGVAGGAPGHYAFEIEVPAGGPREATLRLEGEPNVAIRWLADPFVPWPIGPGTAQLAQMAAAPGVAAAEVSAPDVNSGAAPSSPAASAPPPVGALALGLAAAALAVAAILLLRRSRGAPGGRAADGAPGA